MGKSIIFPVKEIKGDIPGFVDIDAESGQVNFTIPGKMKCIEFTISEIDKQTENTELYVWWEFYAGKIPAKKLGKGMNRIGQVIYKPPVDFKIYARGGNYFRNGNFAFGVLCQKVDA